MPAPIIAKFIGSALADQSQHFLATVGVLEKAAEHAAGNHGYPVRFDAAAGHAAVLCFDDHRNALRLKAVPDRLGDLGGKPFLHLSLLA
jgi:hypothetical protein